MDPNSLTYLQELLYEDSEYEYYKVPVANGRRLDEGAVPETCQAGI